ncbi:AAA family ATPase [Dactylosporangium sp. CS-033363]|uniref:AAA family ATPase n=1 Tax=Dactylosporangium sp. CS-033363 TaxID=3239935 RepID=UPI003D8E36A5
MSTATVAQPAAQNDDPWAGMETAEPPADQARRRPAVPAQRREERPKFQLRLVQPTGLVSWPLLAVSGDEYSGKSTQAAKLSASPLIGHTYWLPIGDDPHPHAAVPGARYQIAAHDGTWPDIMNTAQALADLADRHHAAGHLPTLIVVDSGSEEWKMLSEWADKRARNSVANRDRLQRDPDAEVEIGRMYWNDANKRHRRLMRILKQSRAIVVVTTRGKWVSDTNPATGQPKAGAPRVWTHEGQKDLGFESQAYVRLERAGYPTILGVRLPVGGIVPGASGEEGQPFIFDGRKRGKRPALPAEAFSLEWLIFKLMRFDHTKAQVLRTYDPVLDTDDQDHEDVDGPATVAVPDGASEAPGRVPPSVVQPTEGAAA